MALQLLDYLKEDLDIKNKDHLIELINDPDQNHPKILEIRELFRTVTFSRTDQEGTKDG